MNSAIKSGQVQAESRKVFSRGDDDPPYPTYTNSVEFTAMGIDVFMDVGIAQPESIQAALQASQNPSQGAPIVNVNVLFRFGMTLQTAAQMHQRLTELLQATQEQIRISTAQTKQNG